MGEILKNFNMNSKSNIYFFLVLLVVCSAVTLTSGRYLPTRSDNSRMQRYKEALRVLMELAEAENDPSQAYIGGRGPGGLAEGQSLYDVRPNLISKRSISGSRIDSENSLRSLKSGI